MTNLSLSTSNSLRSNDLGFQTIFVVIPLYNHCETRILAFIREIMHAGFFPLIINNNKNPIYFDNVKIFNNGSNFGIAKALNQGIEFALESNAEQILLFDQDSFLMSDHLTILSKSASQLFSNDLKIAAAGPMFFEGNSNQLHGFAQYGTLKIIKEVRGHGAQPCLFLITSGTVLNPRCLRQVGLMDQSLFIDYVDVEWCLRAASLGYKIYGIPDVIMSHEVGYFKKEFLWYKIPYHSQFRLYFQTRNSLIMYMRNYIPLRWKVYDMIYFFKRTFFYVCIEAVSIKTISRAILDAIKFKN